MKPQRIVCAPDSFKESMSALEAALALATGIHRVLPDVDCDIVPMADGGEGTTQALVDALLGQLVETECVDALGRHHQASYGFVPERQLAIIEIAAACGLGQIAPAERDIRTATSYGVGELIRDALNRGARKFIVGLGGSATNDAGVGMAQALGVRFLNAHGDSLPPGGAALAHLTSIDLTGIDPRLATCEFELACDVDNPLLGKQGASAVFGPQKGASTPELVAELDAALGVWAAVVEPAAGREVREIPGSGAAGGLGAAFLAFTNNEIKRGVDLVVETVALADRVAGADWVFTGEGSIDSQTLHGKTPWGVAQAAAKAGVPVVMFGGRITPDADVLLEHDAVALVPIVRSVGTLEDALKAGPENLAAAAEMTVRLLTASHSSCATGNSNIHSDQ